MSKITEKVDLKKIFMGLQRQMITKLCSNREILEHPTAKGDASELNWIEMLASYLPKRYKVDKAFVLDSEGTLSEQIDVVVYDQQYSPFLFRQDDAIYIPSESVYGIFEVKQDLSKATIEYAAHKTESVRKLKRTSVEIPHAGGKYKPKKPFEIIAGVLTLGSEWKPPLGSSLDSVCSKLSGLGRVDLGCCLKYGGFDVRYGASLKIEKSGEDDALIFFFLRLLARLQRLGTAPAMDISMYGKVIKAKK